MGKALGPRPHLKGRDQATAMPAYLLCHQKKNSQEVKRRKRFISVLVSREAVASTALVNEGGSWRMTAAEGGWLTQRQKAEALCHGGIRGCSQQQVSLMRNNRARSDHKTQTQFSFLVTSTWRHSNYGTLRQWGRLTTVSQHQSWDKQVLEPWQTHTSQLHSFSTHVQPKQHPSELQRAGPDSTPGATEVKGFAKGPSNDITLSAMGLQPATFQLWA